MKRRQVWSPQRKRGKGSALPAMKLKDGTHFLTGEPPSPPRSSPPSRGQLLPPPLPCTHIAQYRGTAHVADLSVPSLPQPTTLLRLTSCQYIFPLGNICQSLA